MKNTTLLTILMALPLLTFAQGPWEFNTDGDTEGWTKSNSDALVVSGGLVTLTPNGNNPKLIHSAANINTTAVQYAHITVVNNTSNTYLRISYPKSTGGRAYSNIDMAANAPSTTYDLDLSGTFWTGTINDLQIHVRGAGNTNAVLDGTLLFDSIAVDNNPTLSTATFEVSKYSVFPNPAKGQITINGNRDIFNIAIYDLTGKNVLSQKNLVNNTVNISSLNAGLYLLQIEDEKGSVSTKKLAIK